MTLQVIFTAANETGSDKDSDNESDKANDTDS